MPDRTGLVAPEPDGWVITNGKILRYTDEPVDNEWATYLHRATCPAIEDVPWLGDASPPEIRAGYWWDRLVAIKTTPNIYDQDAMRELDADEEPKIDLNHPKGTPFEVLCHFHFQDSFQLRWLQWEFCPICVDDMEHRAMEDFVSMLNADELATALDEVAARTIDGDAINFSWNALFDLLTAVANRLRATNENSIDLLNPKNDN